MQPNRAVTPWGGVATLVTVALVIAVVVLGFSVLSLSGGDGGTEDGAMYDHACVTIGQDDLDDGDFSGSGPVRRAADREVVCRSYDSLDHPWLVQRLVDLRGLPVLLAVTGCLVGLRRVIERTRDGGPFTAEAVHGLRRLRPWATGFVLLGTVAYWVLGGIANDLVANASWPESGFLWPTSAPSSGSPPPSDSASSAGGSAPRRTRAVDPPATPPTDHPLGAGRGRKSTDHRRAGAQDRYPCQKKARGAPRGENREAGENPAQGPLR